MLYHRYLIGTYYIMPSLSTVQHSTRTVLNSAAEAAHAVFHSQPTQTFISGMADKPRGCHSSSFDPTDQRADRKGLEIEDAGQSEMVVIGP